MKVIFRAIQKGLVVSRPINDFGRYDLIIEEAGKLIRAQVKYANGKPISTGTSRVSTKTVHRRGGKRHYTKEDVDVLMIYLPLTDKVYKLPPHVWAGKTEVQLRHEPPKNNMHKNVFMASDYEW